MTKRTLVLGTTLLLVAFAPLRAQVGFSFPTYLNTLTGQEVHFPVRVVNFDSVIGIQFIVNWDPAVIKYQGISLQHNPLNLVDTVRFNLRDTSLGKIRFVWNTGPAARKTLPDGDSIFSIKFKVVGANGTFTDVKYTEDTNNFPFLYFETVAVAGAQSILTTINTSPLVQGRVEVGTSSTDEASLIPQLKMAPNPATDAMTVTFEAPTNQDVEMLIVDQGGKRIFQRNINGAAGLRGTVIAKDDLPAAGLYYMQLRMGDITVVRSFIFQ
jgi:hypothetical protein